MNMDILYLGSEDSAELGIYTSTQLLKSKEGIERANRMTLEEFVAEFNSDMISDQGIIALVSEIEYI